MKKSALFCLLFFLPSIVFSGFGGQKASAVRKIIYEKIPVFVTYYETKTALKSINIEITVTDTSNMKWQITSDSAIIFIDTKTLSMQTKKTKAVAVIEP